MEEHELNARDPNDQDLLISEWVRYGQSGKADGSRAYETLAGLIERTRSRQLRFTIRGLMLLIALSALMSCRGHCYLGLGRTGPPRRIAVVEYPGGHGEGEAGGHRGEAGGRDVNERAGRKSTLTCSPFHRR